MWPKMRPTRFSWLEMKPDWIYRRPPAMFGLQPGKRRWCADPGRAKTNFYGALNLQTGQEIAMRSDLLNAEVSAQYLELCLEANPNVPILLFWDRAP
jgi:hypothetical protein